MLVGICNTQPRFDFPKNSDPSCREIQQFRKRAKIPQHKISLAGVHMYLLCSIVHGCAGFLLHHQRLIDAENVRSLRAMEWKGNT